MRLARSSGHISDAGLSAVLAGSQRDQLTALERIPPHRRAFFAAHITFQFVHRCGFGSADNVEGDSLVPIAAEAFDLEIAVPPFSASPMAGDGDIAGATDVLFDLWCHRTLHAA